VISLLPVPRESSPRAGSLTAPHRVALALSGKSYPAAEAALEDLFAARGAVRCAPGAPDATTCSLHVGADLPPEGYSLEISQTGVDIAACDAAGALHAVRTWAQLWPARATALPAVSIRDWPDFPRRGFMLDISRDRVPTSAELRALVDRMAALKLNVLQLYTEHTFAFRDHETVWRDASPLTPEEIRQLDAYCAARGIELVPNQNSFGHMERWLRHPEYRHLAEREDGGGCLVPGEASAAFVRSLYDELLPCFASKRLNIGCDETFDLGKGRSREACDASGVGRVYWSHLQRLFEDLQRREQHAEFWGDIVLQHPELIGELPRTGITALAWHYEAPRDPDSLPGALLRVLAGFGWSREHIAGFSGHAPAFEAAGVPFEVCPGTSSWNTFIGRWTNARENIEDALDWGRRSGAEGMLLTDWGDNGHLQPPCISWPGLAFAAATSWCAESQSGLDLAEALGTHVFSDRTTAEAVLDLGDAHTDTGLESINSAPFFVSLRLPLDAPPNAALLRGEPDAGKLHKTVERIEAACERLTGDDGVSADLRQAGGLARHGTWRLLRGRLGTGPGLTELAADLDALRAGQRERWLVRARPGGLEDSLARLDRARDEYAGSGSA